MADLGTQNESLALYRYLCQHIVGTEEYVKTIRMMITVRDNFANTEDFKTITSGSFGEGLHMRGSDLDVMIVCSFCEIPQDTNFLFKSDNIYFAMETDDIQPGFTQLRLLYSYDGYMYKLCEKRGQDFYISSTVFKQQVVTNKFPIVHGPCVSDKKGRFDFALCCHTKLWIKPAMQWITRSNNGWPATNVKQSIVKHGIICVPIGLQGSTNNDLAWRLSFSVGEKFLTYTFTHTQLLCYALMKIIFKDLLESDLDCHGLLCSYFMKTIVFWISEEISPSVWRPDNLISCFMRCFRRLIYCVQNSICPHYFIPENNLFENKIKGHAKEILLNKLNILNSYDWQCILFSHQFSKYNELLFRSLKEPNYGRVDGIQKLLFTIINVSDCKYSKFTLEQGIRIAFSFENFKIKQFHLYYISKMCSVIAQSFTIKNISSNKSTYKQHNLCIRSLLLNLHHDAVSGWLLLASFFYKTRQYNLSIYIIQYILSKCTLEKMHPLMNLSYMHHELLDEVVRKKIKISDSDVLTVFEKRRSWLD
ncbi:uncharacterized protein LOC134698106 [Mytilus trossulus]|uniref:uncharacterized protein LOC134698106 n=1 Tax=Mytilus trossulus TaxID=6551 RepID=UPI0030076846